MSRRAARLVLEAEGEGLERVLGALRFRQAEIESLTVARAAGGVFKVDLAVRARPGRSLPDLAALFSRIGEVRSVEIQEVIHEKA